MTAPERSFRLKPPGPGPAALLGFIALALTFATCVVPWAAGDPVLPGVGVVLVIVALLGWEVLAAYGATVVVTPDRLVVAAGWFGTTFPRSTLGEARRIRFAAEPGLQPAYRTWGAGLPGWGSGWVGLSDSTRAYVCLTDDDEAVLVPLTTGGALLLSPADPQAFLEALREVPVVSS